MKLMFASDIHGSLPATERVLELFAQSGAQWLVILGDVLNHGPRNALPEGYAPAKVAERLNEVAHKVIAVRGNCDSEVDQMVLEFPVMADYALLFSAGRTIFATHQVLNFLCILGNEITSWLYLITHKSGKGKVYF